MAAVAVPLRRDFDQLFRKAIIAATTLAVTLAALSSRAQQVFNDSRWPLQVNTSKGQVTIYEPELDDFAGDVLTFRAGVSVEPRSGGDPVFGVAWVQEQISIDSRGRKARPLSASVLRTHFTTDDPSLETAAAEAVSQAFVDPSDVIKIDQLQSELASIQKESADADQLPADAPQIIFRDHPAVKIEYDGAPQFMPADKSKLQRAVNTPFFVVFDPAGNTYYLKGGGQWFRASDPMGPFAPIIAAPTAASRLAADSGYQDPKGNSDIDPATPIEIVTASTPTELIYTDGPMQMEAIPGTQLLYASNTDSDVFQDLYTQQYFVLLSGRWYSADSLVGPWAFVPPDELPSDFAQIPPDSEKANVLASVSDTPAAQDAVDDAYIPQIAAVDTAKYDQPPVTYDGDPKFEPIRGTTASYAVNTGASVVRVGADYYACDNAVWYRASAPRGPWVVTAYVPPTIYAIPPSYPIYPVRFVRVYGHRAGVIYFGYRPGYLGGYIHRHVVVFGTGYRYRPWIGHIYFPRPCTFGYFARYDWYTGRWGFQFAHAYGGGAYWVGVGYGPRFPRQVWFGYGGYRPCYAPNRMYIMKGASLAAADRARGAAFSLGIYESRSDVRRDLASSERVRTGQRLAAEQGRQQRDVVRAGDRPNRFGNGQLPSRDGKNGRGVNRPGNGKPDSLPPKSDQLPSDGKSGTNSPRNGSGTLPPRSGNTPDSGKNGSKNPGQLPPPSGSGRGGNQPGGGGQPGSLPPTSDNIPGGGKNGSAPEGGGTGQVPPKRGGKPRGDSANPPTAPDQLPPQGGTGVSDPNKGTDPAIGNGSLPPGRGGRGNGNGRDGKSPAGNVSPSQGAGAAVPADGAPSQSNANRPGGGKRSGKNASDSSAADPSSAGNGARAKRDPGGNPGNSRPGSAQPDSRGGRSSGDAKTNPDAGGRGRGGGGGGVGGGGGSNPSGPPNGGNGDRGKGNPSGG
ncbi:MAG TPA: hypothetical protein VL992_08960 [Tepidisphaeraceae bacterium]|nr:hypothetical protein [Tepidisphaeraceae bacterium]